MSLLLILSRFVTAFLQKGKHLLNFMAAVTVASDFGVQENSLSLFPHLLAMKWWDQMSWPSFFECWVLSQHFHSPLSPSSSKNIPSSPSAIRVMSSDYPGWLIFLLAILIPVCASTSPAFCMMYSTHELYKQGDNMQPWHTPSPIWKQSVIPCPVLTVASWPAYRFLKRKVRWSGISISLRIFHSLCSQKSSSKQKPRTRCLHSRILPKI